MLNISLFRLYYTDPFDKHNFVQGSSVTGFILRLTVKVNPDIIFQDYTPLIFVFGGIDPGSRTSGLQVAIFDQYLVRLLSGITFTVSLKIKPVIQIYANVSDVPPPLYILNVKSRRFKEPLLKSIEYVQVRLVIVSNFEICLIFMKILILLMCLYIGIINNHISIVFM